MDFNTQKLRDEGNNFRASKLLYAAINNKTILLASHITDRQLFETILNQYENKIFNKISSKIDKKPYSTS